jgi:hypothetical protein
VGEICVLRGVESGALDLAAADGPREYRLVVQSASEVPGAVASMRLALLGPDAPSNAEPAISRVDAGRPPTPEALSAEAASRAELVFRENARKELERVRARPYRPAADRPDARHDGPVRRATVATAAPPSVGSIVTFRNSVAPDISVECDRTETITAVVKAVGQRIAIAEDQTLAGFVSASEYSALLQDLDEIVFPVDSAYFGAAADLDGNERVWILFSSIVNRLTSRGSSTFIAGFFNPSDLSDTADCPASNQGEVLYLLAADPSGVFSDPVTSSFAVRNARGTSAHELQHLLTAQQRVTFGGGSLFTDLEESWLSEGLAHTAETVTGLKLEGLATRANLTLAALGGDGANFDAYHLSNFRRLGEYLAEPTRTLSLGNAAGADPGGVPSLRMRGFSWLFLRWLADQFAPASSGGILSGSGEEALFQELSRGGSDHLSGIANVERAVQILAGPTQWADLFGEYAMAPAVDDDAPAQVPARLQIPSFDLRDIFSGLHQSRPTTSPFTVEYPLVTTTETLVPSTNRMIDFDLGATTARYFVLSSDGPHPAVSILLTTPTGAEVPQSARPQLTLVRTR